MNVKIGDSWKNLLEAEFQKPYFQTLVKFVKEEYSTFKCFPPGNQIFAAFDHCLFDDVKVVIIGQDPYHGPGQANGLCFSVNDSISHPPSLVNIFKEIQTDLGKPYPKSGNLERWAQQGVLLLNATLSVRANQAGSHQNKGWEQFTDKVISTISEEREEIIFLLWGKFAQDKSKLIDKSKHNILMSSHPSPLSSYRGFLGCKHFSKCNNILKTKMKSEINWQL